MYKTFFNNVVKRGNAAVVSRSCADITYLEYEHQHLWEKAKALFDILYPKEEESRGKTIELLTKEFGIHYQKYIDTPNNKEMLKEKRQLRETLKAISDDISDNVHLNVLDNEIKSNLSEFYLDYAKIKLRISSLISTSPEEKEKNNELAKFIKETAEKALEFNSSNKNAQIFIKEMEYNFPEYFESNTLSKQ